MHDVKDNTYAMKSRVTITLDPVVHARAKQFARQRRTTVSGLIETFLRSPSAGSASPREGKSLVDGMLGSAKLRVVEPGGDALFDALHARYVAASPRSRRGKP